MEKFKVQGAVQGAVQGPKSSSRSKEQSKVTWAGGLLKLLEVSQSLSLQWLPPFLGFYYV
ncbi:hypothetical protein EYF80_051593 [Liparis tanakae]|uniref:Uncharacterized protein n=1 Tax=Liparis tanakae TaxID=230148 RepID=A0A4Z2FBU1_9TELE|nr:hypothetical protein EYF80_051593 [Liparis tanakae]